MENVVLRVDGIRFPGTSEEETVEFVTEGKMYEKGGSLFLVYEESELSGFEGCTTTLRIAGEKVSMIRFVRDSMMNVRMDFEEGRPYEGYYGTPYGAIEFGIETNRIISKVSLEDGGYLSIDYDMKLVGLSEGRNLLSIRVLKRGEK